MSSPTITNPSRAELLRAAGGAADTTQAALDLWDSAIDGARLKALRLMWDEGAHEGWLLQFAVAAGAEAFEAARLVRDFVAMQGDDDF